VPFTVRSRWFEGRAKVQTYVLDELLATKLRALYQRRRGRDLFDLWDAVTNGTVEPARVIEGFLTYLKNEGVQVSRAQFERNLAAKVRDAAFLNEVRPMLAASLEYDPMAAVELIRTEFIARLPGEAWRGR
jgi:predicted nucleotidyltransferase component of viral defense system